MRVRDIITDPVYVKADTDVYEFFRAQGAEVVNDVSQFIGTNGAYLYTGDKAPQPFLCVALSQIGRAHV